MVMGPDEIRKILPHRYPFLFVDRVEEVVPGKRIVAIKNVTMNEPYLPGHFPELPVMPGVLMAEAMAQTSAILAILIQGRLPPAETMLLVGMDRVRFRRMVRPGDQMKIEMELLQQKGDVWKFGGAIFVEGRKVVEGELLAMKGILHEKGEAGAGHT